MSEFLTDLTIYQRVFFVISVSSTLILIIQTILALIGLSGNEDFDIGDSGADGIDGVDIDAAGADIDVGGGVDLNDLGERVQAHIYDHGLRIFTVRGIMAFLMMGGWVGFLLSISGIHNIIASAIAFASGVIALLFMAKIMQMLLTLQADGTMKVRNALGQVGQVYIRIPGGEKGMGKVNVTVQERFCEFDAVTEEDESIKTGEAVYVTDVRPGNILVVEKLEQGDKTEEK